MLFDSTKLLVLALCKLSGYLMSLPVVCNSTATTLKDVVQNLSREELEDTLLSILHYVFERKRERIGGRVRKGDRPGLVRQKDLVIRNRTVREVR